MDKKLKGRFYYVAALLIIFVVPTLMLHFFNQSDDDEFYDRVRKDHETCVQRAERYSIDDRWCDEIRDASRTTYDLSSGYSRTNALLMFTQPLLFILLIGMMNLKKQVEELKEKINE